MYIKTLKKFCEKNSTSELFGCALLYKNKTKHLYAITNLLVMSYNAKASFLLFKSQVRTFAKELLLDLSK